MTDGGVYVKVNLNEKWQAVLECFSSAARLDILRLLAEQPLNISELADRLCISSPVVTRHVARLENAGLVTSRMMPGKRGIKKVCVLCEQQLIIDLTCEDTPPAANASAVLPLGAYVTANVTAPCGLMAAGRTLGLQNDPRYFQNPERQTADMLWFSSGTLNYILPDTLSLICKNLEIQFWMCCKTYFHQNVSQLSLTFSCGDSTICTVSETVHASSEDSPAGHTQAVTPLDIHGEKRVLRITETGTWYNQERVSDFSSADLSRPRLSLTISSSSRNNLFYLFGHNGTGFLLQTDRVNE